MSPYLDRLLGSALLGLGASGVLGRGAQYFAYVWCGLLFLYVAACAVSALVRRARR